MINIILKNGKEKSLLRRHPWIFTGAIAKTGGNPSRGETVRILSSDGTPLGFGAYSPDSQIAVRIWTFDPNENISSEFIKSRIEQAVQMRDFLKISESSSAYRLINAESDNLPGLIVDRYNDFLVCQFLSTGAEYWKDEIVRQLEKLIPCTGIYDRSDADVRNKEGLSPSTGVLYGKNPPELIEIREGTCRFAVDIHRGHKTGFYLDQRVNRAVAAEYAKGKSVLNCFAYTGGFGIWAIKGGAESVTNIESSSSALELIKHNMELNNIDAGQTENVEGNVFQVLRQYRESCRQFDLIILDPPKFAESKSQLERACRGYKDINLLAFRLLKEGGVLFTFSCSGLVSSDLFQKIVADAALDAGRDAQIIQRLTQPSDHPTALNFPEGSYLKGLICRMSR